MACRPASLALIRLADAALGKDRGQWSRRFATVSAAPREPAAGEPRQGLVSAQATAGSSVTRRSRSAQDMKS
jgi:hypothetical protein